MIPTKPQLNQLSVKFNKAPNNSSVVQDVIDLVSIKHKYQGMLVWVLNSKKFYYLKDNCAGTIEADWEMYGSTFTFTGWDSQRVYYQYTCIYYNQNLYMAIQDVPVGTPPTDTDYWEMIAGESFHLEIPFVNQYSISFDLPIVNPTISVYKKNSDDLYEFILCDIKQTELIPNGTRWLVSFMEENEPITLNGIIIIK